jgi:hypothetical protein
MVDPGHGQLEPGGAQPGLGRRAVKVETGNV